MKSFKIVKVAKKILLISIFFVLFFLSTVPVDRFEVTVANAQIKYQPLAPIEGYVTAGDANNLDKYLNDMFRLGIAIAGGLAVFMIIIGGIQYMSTDAVSGKSDGKSRIQAAITGLLVALGAYMILNTLDPKLLSTKLGLQDLRGITSAIPVTAQRGKAVDVGAPDYPYLPSDPRYGQTASAVEIIPLPNPPQPTGNHLILRVQVLRD